MTVINLFGEGIRYHICRVPIDEFHIMEKYRLQHSLDWEHVIFDLELMSSWGYSNLDNFHMIHSGNGWLINEKNFLEIRRKGKKRRKIKSLELISNLNLFNLYNLDEDRSDLDFEKGSVVFAIVQIETGLVFKYQLDKQNFSLNDFTFCKNYQPLSLSLQENWITNIKYLGKDLINSMQDTLIRSNRVYLIKD